MRDAGEISTEGSALELARHFARYAMAPAGRQDPSAGAVGWFGPGDLRDYFAKVSTEIEQLESDIRAHPPAAPKPPWAEFLGAWIVFTASPEPQTEAYPPAGWRAFKAKWDSWDTYAFYDDAWVAARIEMFARRYLELRSAFESQGGKPTGPKPELGPTGGQDGLGDQIGRGLNKLFWLGLLFGGVLLFREIRHV